MRTEGLRSQ